MTEEIRYPHRSGELDDSNKIEGCYICLRCEGRGYFGDIPAKDNLIEEAVSAGFEFFNGNPKPTETRDWLHQILSDLYTKVEAAVRESELTGLSKTSYNMISFEAGSQEGRAEFANEVANWIDREFSFVGGNSDAELIYKRIQSELT